MSAVCLPAGFSTSEVACKVEQKFGLPGYARLVKILELLAASETAAAGIVSLSPSDWLEALRIRGDELDTFLRYLQQAGWLECMQPAEHGQPLVVTLCDPAQFRIKPAGPVLFTKPEQWATWCQSEFGMTRELATDPHTQQLFRRWCVSHVTIDELQAAALQAAKVDNSLAPHALNKHVAEIRKAALAKAAR